MTKRLLSLLGVSALILAVAVIHRHRELAREVELWKEATDPVE